MVEVPKPISRRNFLKLAGLTIAETALVACSRNKPEPPAPATPTPMVLKTPDATFTPTSTATATPTFTPEPTYTPESSPTPIIAPTPERIEVAIPGLIVEKYHYQFENVTDQIAQVPISTVLYGWIQDLPDAPYTRANPTQSCGESLLRLGELKNGNIELLYFDADNESYYNLKTEDEGLRKMLDWERIIFSNSRVTLPNHIKGYPILCDGKILYIITEQSLIEAYFNDRWPPEGLKQAVILADVPNETRTIIRDGNLTVIEPHSSGDMQKLLLSFPFDKEARRGTYLVDSNDWSVKFHLEGAPLEMFLNEDGSLLYEIGNWYDRLCQTRGEAADFCPGYIHNTITGNRESVDWNVGLTPYEHVASTNLYFIARELGMFRSDTTVEGQRGILIQTPVGEFIISSPTRSFSTARIDNDGTIRTWREDVFKFENGTYKLVETTVDETFEVTIDKVGEGLKLP